MWGGRKIFHIGTFHATRTSSIMEYPDFFFFLPVWTLLKNPAKRILKLSFLLQNGLKMKHAEGVVRDTGTQIGSRKQR